MNLQEVKDTLNIQQFNLNTATDVDGNPTEWMRHWDNDNRVAVSFHKETVQKIVAKEPLNFGIQTEEREGEKGKYKAIRVVAFTPAEIVI